MKKKTIGEVKVKTKRSKYIYWTEIKYLINIKYPRITENDCYECNHVTRRLHWFPKGFIKTGEVKHRRKRGFMDDMAEQLMAEWSNTMNMFLDHEPSKKPIKMLRYGKLKK